MLSKQNLCMVVLLVSGIYFFQIVLSNAEDICEICNKHDNRPLLYFEYSTPHFGMHSECRKIINPCMCSFLNIFSGLNSFEREQFHKIYMDTVQQEVLMRDYDSILSFYEAQGREQLTFLFNTVGATAIIGKLKQKIDAMKDKQSINLQFNNLLIKEDCLQGNNHHNQHKQKSIEFEYEQKLIKFEKIKKYLENLCQESLK